jgi:DNA polymerase-3 subunit delta'
MSLKEIFCQDKAIEIMQLAFAADKVPHAYIFTGLDGIGKFKTAREWGKLLLCKNPVVKNGFADTCGKCDSCQSFDAGSHPDFNHVYKELLEFTEEGKNKTTPISFPIDVVREFLIAKTSSKPTLSERKVFVVSEGEKLQTPAQNCMLKTLEEPPPYCFIILLCSRLDKLLPTIKSRCQIIRFSPIEENIIVEKLKESGIKQEPARYFARLSDGSIGQALQWAKLELSGAALYETKRNLVTSLANYKYGDALDLEEDFLSEAKKIIEVWEEIDKNTSKSDLHRRAIKTILQIIVAAISDTMKLPVIGDTIVNSDQKGDIKKLAARFSPPEAAQKIEDCYKAIQYLEANVNEKLIFDQLLCNLAISDKMKV